MKNNQKGFTLVEIAIVLVIIGLLLGGILKGQEMIIQAKIKNAITDYSGVSAAYFGYQDRYRATPGDDPQATRWSGAVPGDGNRVLTGTYNDQATAVTSVLAANESRLWWDHLRRSGFLSGAGATNPNNAFNGILGVQTGDGPTSATTAPVAVLAGFTALIMCSTNLPDKVAIALDVQMDDGILTTGFVRGLDVSGSTTAIASSTVPTNVSYVENGTTFYTLCRQF
jgi:prepilin-type N-terminal cleavage/methylation domain-containing protein